MAYRHESVAIRKAAVAEGKKRYFTGAPCSKGHVAERTTNQGACVVCRALDDKAPARRAYAKKRYDLSPTRALLGSARARAKKHGVPFDLSIDDIKIPEKCPVLGTPFKLGSGKRSWYSPSVDRIVPSVGYVPSNVRVISWRANWLKSNGTHEELLAVIRYMEQA